MANDERRMTTRLLLAVLIVVILTLSPQSAPLTLWQAYTFREDSFHLLHPSPVSHVAQPTNQQTNQLTTPPSWHITAAVLADVTNDGALEWALLVWRPWRDWPIQRWVPAPSLITGFHDAAGDSCHLILLDPQCGREIWAGSALPAPLLALAVGDVNGDSRNEVVTLEGDYATGRDGPATHVDVWRWNGFGFTLEWRSPAGTWRQLYLTDVNNDGILDIAVR